MIRTQLNFPRIILRFGCALELHDIQQYVWLFRVSFEASNSFDLRFQIVSHICFHCFFVILVVLRLACTGNRWSGERAVTIIREKSTYVTWLALCTGLWPPRSRMRRERLRGETMSCRTSRGIVSPCFKPSARSVVFGLHVWGRWDVERLLVYHFQGEL